MHYTSRH